MLFRAPETRSRSLVKAFSWRALGSLDTFVISYFVTGNFVFAGSIASVETVTKIVLFYFHERIWTIVRWGRVKAPEHPASVEPTPAVAPAVTQPLSA